MSSSHETPIDCYIGELYLLSEGYVNGSPIPTRLVVLAICSSTLLSVCILLGWTILVYIFRSLILPALTWGFQALCGGKALWNLFNHRLPVSSQRDEVASFKWAGLYSQVEDT